mmetsp:Transcript_31930/g.63262  ORF Transcript_31930/g.63262 Transcript_31930/m.63262 type:complete len:81 (-) Transcript_31930:1857-2099(-)
METDSFPLFLSFFSYSYHTLHASIHLQKMGEHAHAGEEKRRPHDLDLAVKFAWREYSFIRGSFILLQINRVLVSFSSFSF